MILSLVLLLLKHITVDMIVTFLSITIVVIIIVVDFGCTLVHRGGSRLEPFEAMTSGAEGSGNVQTMFKLLSHWGQSKTMTFL